MATIVLVHGIAQEQLAAPVLESTWLPALAGGVANSGNPELADRIWRAGVLGDIDVRMAYYGTPFIDPGAQGAPDVDLDTEPLPDDVEELTEQLAMTWLHTAAESAKDPSDRRQAHNELDIITGTVGEAQGPRATLGRPALNALANLRWFAPFGMAVAGRFVWQALTQVARYLTDDEIRSYAQDQVLHLIGPDTRLVIGHSLGSVVAYEAAHRTDHTPHPHHTRVTAGPEKRGLRTTAPPTPTRSRSGHPVGKPRRRRRPRRRPPRPRALLPTRTRIHRHTAHPHRRHRLQTPRHHPLPHQTHRRAHHHRNACRTVKLTKSRGWVSRHRPDTSEVNTSHHSLDFTCRR